MTSGLFRQLTTVALGVAAFQLPQQRQHGPLDRLRQRRPSLDDSGQFRVQCSALCSAFFVYPSFPRI